MEAEDPPADIRAYLDACWEAVYRGDPMPPIPADLSARLDAAELRDVEIRRDNIAGERRASSGFATPPPGYEVLEHVATGAQATVHRGLRVATGESVAIKIFDVPSEDFATRAERAHLEAEALGRAVGRGVVRILDSGRTPDGHQYLALEWIHGPTLEALLPENGQVPARDVAHTLLALARALAPAHRAGLAHRDVKPGNVMFRDARWPHRFGSDALRGPLNPVWIDFGVAWREADIVAERTGLGQVAGTLRYLAPEQIHGHRRGDIGPSTDIFALGGIAYRMLFGTVPFNGAGYLVTGEILRAEPAFLRAPPRNADPALLSIVARCLEKSPRRRYADADALASDLERMLAGRPPAAPRLTRIRRAWRTCRRNAVLAASILVVGIALVTATAISTHAARRSARAVALAAETLTTITDAIAEDPGLTRNGHAALQAKLLDATIGRLEDFSRAENPDLSARLRGQAALSLTVSLDALGRFEAAVTAAEHAARLLRHEYVRTGGTDRRITYLLGKALVRSGTMRARHAGDPNGAELQIRESLRLLEPLRAADGGTDADLAHLTALAWNNLANMLGRAGRFDAAIDAYREAIARLRIAADADPRARIWLPKALSNLGIALSPTDPEEAEVLLREAAVLARTRFEALDPETASDLRTPNPDAGFERLYREALAITETNLGEFLLDQDRAEEADALLWSAVEHYSQLSLMDPASFEFAWSVAMARTNVAALAAAGVEGADPELALGWIDAAWRWYGSALERHPEVTELPGYVLRHWAVHAAVLRRAEQDMRTLLDRIEATVVDSPLDDAHLLPFADCALQLVDGRPVGRPDDGPTLARMAAKLSDRAAELAATREPASVAQAARLELRVARIYRADGDVNAARECANAARHRLDAIRDAASQEAITARAEFEAFETTVGIAAPR